MQDFFYEPQNRCVCDLPNEVWKAIPNFDGVYYISNYGRVKSIGRMMWRGNRNYKSKTKILSQNKSCGYMIVMLYNEFGRKNYRVHRLIAEAFIPNPENKPQINHKNGVRNDNRICNLEWTNQSENMIHMRDVLNKRTPKWGDSKLSKVVYMYSIDGDFIGSEKGLRHLQSMGYCRVSIRRCANGKKRSYRGIVWTFDYFGEKYIR